MGGCSVERVHVSIMHAGSWGMLASGLVIWMSVLTQEYMFWYLRVFLYLPKELLTVGTERP